MAAGLPDDRTSLRGTCNVSGLTQFPWRCAMIYKKSSLWFFIFVTLVSSLVVTHGLASAVELALTWNDNSTDEDGFYIERRVGTSGTYQQIAGVGRNVASYTDANLSNGTTYCYRVRAFNAVGNSAYSNENCATTPAATFAVA